MARTPHFSGDVYEGPVVASVEHIERITVDGRILEVSPLGYRCPTCGRVHAEPTRCKCYVRQLGTMHKHRDTAARFALQRVANNRITH